MILNHRDDIIDGIMRLTFEEDSFSCKPFVDSEERLLTIAWNKGPDQQVIVDEEELILKSNHVIIFSLSQSFQFDKPKDIIALQFNRDFYCILDHDHEVSCAGLLFYGKRENPIICLSGEQQRKHELLFQVFLDEFNEQDDNLKTEMLRIILKRLIVKLTRTYKSQENLDAIDETDMDLIRRFNVLVEQHFKEHHQVQDYADLIHKSSKTISNLFSKYSDKSPLQTIHERILMEAKRLLIYTDKTTKEIAYELGFQDIPGFSRFFKKNTTIAPSKYREEQRNRLNGKN
ncbi:helix-turn-helix domain-containing protein [Ekhidna sp. To15]|uniref:helix-turn-helix domain-containing protein n=1 Tax=Ekhidna sp. To15 TaxID=3395267 RepID=UPI003F5226E6